MMAAASITMTAASIEAAPAAQQWTCRAATAGLGVDPIINHAICQALHQFQQMQQLLASPHKTTLQARQQLSSSI
jgi:hypothetical protein